MNQKNVKIVACALASAVILSGSGFNASAAGVSSILPAAGLALALGEGTSLIGVKTDSFSVSNNALVKSVIQNNIKSAAPVTAETVLLTATQISAVAVDKTFKEEISTEPETPSVIPEVTVSGNATEEGTAPDHAGETEKPLEDTAEGSTLSGNAAVEEEKTVSSNELTEEEKLFSTLVIAKVNDYVNVRDIASEEGQILGKLYDKSVGTFVSEDNGWYQIQSGNVTGFVKAEYVVTGDAAIELAKQVGIRIATVTTTTLKVRQEPGLDKPVLGLVPIEDELVVLEEGDGWVKVSIEEGEGFVSGEFVTLSTEFVKAESKAEEEARLAKEEAERKAAHAAAAKVSSSKEYAANSKSKQIIPPASSGSGVGSSLANFATQFVGNPYVYGGTSLTNGADCSGFVLSVYKNYGVNLPHSSGAQRSVGSDVGGLGNAQPGDIVCYSGHVGIYIGGGSIVHASTAATGIKISNASYRNVLSVRRVF